MKNFLSTIRHDLCSQCNVCVFNNRDEEDPPCCVCVQNINADSNNSEYGNKQIKIKKPNKFQFKAQVIINEKKYRVKSIMFNDNGAIIEIMYDAFRIVSGCNLENVELVLEREVKS